MKRRALVLSVLLATLSPISASADEPDAAHAHAAEVKKRGDEAMDTGRPADALAAYVEAYALTKDPALLYNKGRALMALTEHPQALDELEAFDRVAPPELRERVPGLAKMIADLRGRVATVAVACDLTGAKVRVRERTVGTCPLPGPIRVNAGKATLEVEAEGHFPWTRDADLPGGGVASFDVKLVSKQTSGVLTVTTRVVGADVAIDGKPLGNAPVEATLLAGTHEISVRKPGYRDAKTSAVLTAGERRTIDVPLESEPSVLGRWWFWTGAAVVVAGGVTLAVALSTERSPEKGTVPPGVVTGGLHSAGFRF